MIKQNAGRFRTLMHSCRPCLIHECGAGARGVKSGERGARQEEEEEGQVPQVDPHLLADSARSQEVLPFLFSLPASLIILAPTLYFCSAPTLLSISKTLDIFTPNVFASLFPPLPPSHLRQAFFHACYRSHFLLLIFYAFASCTEQPKNALSRFP